MKTPLAFLVLLGWSLWLALRKRVKIAAPVAYAVVILAIAMSSRINIGVRHVLPLYASFAVIAGVGAAELLREENARAMADRVLVFGLFGWQVISRARCRIRIISLTPMKSRAEGRKISWPKAIWIGGRTCTASATS